MLRTVPGEAPRVLLAQSPDPVATGNSVAVEPGRGAYVRSVRWGGFTGALLLVDGSGIRYRLDDEAADALGYAAVHPAPVPVPGSGCSRPGRSCRGSWPRVSRPGLSGGRE